MNYSENIQEIFYAALKAVNPYETVIHHSETVNSIFRSGHYQKLLLIGFGKAACPMAKSMEEHLKDITKVGIIITKYGHCMRPYVPDRFAWYEAGHPVPDENGLKATEEVIKLLKGSDEGTLVVCLISGGGSALLVSPYDSITMMEKSEINRLLLKAGADIFELNTVRKHLSNVKGGRLAELAYPSGVISLILSDVIGDKLDVIASGPTSPDGSTYGNAYRVIEKYNLTEIAPTSVIHLLRNGMSGQIPETPKAGNKIFDRVTNIIIGSNRIALEAAREKAELLGLQAQITSTEIIGEAKEVGRMLAERAIGIKNRKASTSPLCLISGGETTVTVKGTGLGGRNMELALAFAIGIKGFQGITLLSAGTDGTDGPTDSAGAIVNGQTVVRAKTLDLNPEEFLHSNDSYHFFQNIDGLFTTGPTGTNVMDIQIVLIE